MLYAFPTSENLWAKYAEIRAECLRRGEGIAEATEFYRQHQEAMDEGAVVAWPERYNHDELSAIQHAMNLKLQDDAAFWAEYQNDPILEEDIDDESLTPDQIAAKTNGLDRGVIPIGCNYLTMFVDVQQKLLFYVVAAWADDFTGYVVDYGSWPDQRREYFTLRDARITLAMKAPGAGLEGSIYRGLETLTADLLGREWRRDDGAVMRIDRCLIDANWGNSTDVVYQFCRQSPHAAVVMPSHGRFVGASSVPFSEYKRKRGGRVGHNWRVPNVRGRRAVRHVVFDSLMPPILDQFGRPIVRDRPRPHWRRLLGKYDAAQTTDDNLRHWANADSLSADSANSPEVRRKLRSRARYEAANNSYCRGMVDTLANDVIGTGPRIQVLTGNKDADARIEREFSRWAKAVKLAKKLRTMRKAKCVDGEAFGLLMTNNRL